MAVFSSMPSVSFPSKQLPAVTWKMVTADLTERHYRFSSCSINICRLALAIHQFWRLSCVDSRRKLIWPLGGGADDIDRLNVAFELGLIASKLCLFPYETVSAPLIQFFCKGGQSNSSPGGFLKEWVPPIAKHNRLPITTKTPGSKIYKG